MSVNNRSTEIRGISEEVLLRLKETSLEKAGMIVQEPEAWYGITPLSLIH